MTMTRDKIEELKRLAEKATPGPWMSGANECMTKDRAVEICKESIDATPTENTIPYFFEVFLENGLRTALVGNGPTSWENAEFIAAANPQTILSLLALAERALKPQDHVRDAAKMVDALEPQGQSLPELPEPWIRDMDAPEGSRDHFAADQMRDFFAQGLYAGQARSYASQLAIPADCDVRKIMLRVDPGEDGQGVEVYARNVGDVEALLSDLGGKVEEAYASQLALTAGPSPFPERDMSKPAEQQGIFRKFEVRRSDGSDAPGGKHHGCRYFVIDLDHDQHAPAAMAAYGVACASTHPQLSAEILSEFPAPALPAGPVPEDQSELIQKLQVALDFWLPSMPMRMGMEEMAARIESDSYLLVGASGDALPSAEDYGWITKLDASRPPVGYVHLVPDSFSDSYDVRFWEKVAIGTKLYATPQPAPSPAVAQPVADERVLTELEAYKFAKFIRKHISDCGPLDDYAIAKKYPELLQLLMPPAPASSSQPAEEGGKS